MIYITTTAYNAERTIARAVDSILNQTCGDFVYYVIDNGSTDKTWETLLGYAGRDNRIRLLHNEENTQIYRVSRHKRWSRQRLLREIVFAECADDDFHCVLDADDEYHLEFLEKMLAFMHENNLDLASCGFNSIDDNTSGGGVFNTLKLSENLIIESPEDFSLLYEVYSRFAFTVWGNIYKLSLLRKSESDISSFFSIYKDFTEGDIVVMNYILQKTNSYGVLNEVLHNYYWHDKNVSLIFFDDKFKHVLTMINSCKELLLCKCGEVSVKNANGLDIRLYYAIFVRIFNVLIHSSGKSTEEKLNIILEILEHEETKKLRQKLLNGQIVARDDITVHVNPTKEWLANVSGFEDKKTRILKALEDFAFVKRGVLN